MFVSSAMIGVILRFFTLGMVDGSGVCMCCGGIALGLCALCGIYKCSQLRMRDCSCIKWCLRRAGADEFDDFDLTVIVHEASYSSVSKRVTKVRLTAGRQQVQTSASGKASVFQEALQVYVEQGTPHLLAELMDGKTVLANLKLSITKEILNAGPIREREFTMNPKIKGICNPYLKLTVHVQSDADTEHGLFDSMKLSKESQILLQQQLLKGNAVTSDEAREPISAIEAVSQGLKGYLEQFGVLGTAATVFVVIRGPPHQKRYTFCIFKDEKDYGKGVKPSMEVELLKVLNVQEDPGRPDIFFLNYVDSRRSRERLSFRRVDLPTSTWVELLTKLIRLIREEREGNRKGKPAGNGV